MSHRHTHRHTMEKTSEAKPLWMLINSINSLNSFVLKWIIFYQYIIYIIFILMKFRFYNLTRKHKKERNRKRGRKRRKKKNQAVKSWSPVYYSSAQNAIFEAKNPQHGFLNWDFILWMSTNPGSIWFYILKTKQSKTN